MRRRAGWDRTGIPQTLATLTWSDWPSVDTAFTDWTDARQDWAQAHGWPGGDAARHAAEIAEAARTPDEEWHP